MRAHIPLSIFGVIGLVSSIALLATFKPLYDFILEKVSWRIFHYFFSSLFVFAFHNWESLLFFWACDRANKFSAIFVMIFHVRCVFVSNKLTLSFMNSSKLSTRQFLFNFKSFNQRFLFQRIYEITFSTQYSNNHCSKSVNKLSVFIHLNTVLEYSTSKVLPN